MNSGTMLGKASISFSRPVYIQSCASVVGPKEGDGPLKNCFDMICDDPMFGEKKWEAAESAMQKEAAVLAIGKAGLTPDDIRFVFAGDLLAQTIASSFGIAEVGIPFFGLYGACSTMGESLSLGAIAVSAGYGHHILCATSSHFATAEKEFRFPLGYGCQRPLSATWTVTGSAACILSPEAPHPSEIVGSSLLRSTLGSVAITGITTGKVIDFGFRDSLNMGGYTITRNRIHIPAAAAVAVQPLYLPPIFFPVSCPAFGNVSSLYRPAPCFPKSVLTKANLLPESPTELSSNTSVKKRRSDHGLF